MRIFSLKVYLCDSNLIMKFKLLVILIALAGCSLRLSAQTKMETKKEKASYGLGINIAQNLENQGLTDLNIDLVIQGIKDYLAGKEQLSPAESQMALQEYFAELQAAAAQKNLEAGQSFLTKNGLRPEVTTTASGLQYEVLTAGNGPKPAATSQVTVHYHGTLIDGTVFDSSVERGQPATFPVNGVIQGWIEALQLMPQGSKYRLFIPSDLAYGKNGTGSMIGPNSTLIFEVELLAIQ